MKKTLLLTLFICLISSTAYAEQRSVARLHVANGIFSIMTPIGQGGMESSIGPFILETGIYQGDYSNILNDHIVSWQFGFFGPVYNYTAAFNPNYAADTGGPAPSGIVDDQTNTITMDLSSWFAWWNGTTFNQGGSATGSYDPVSGAFTLNWSKLIVGGPFDGATGYWQLNGFVELNDGPVPFIPIVEIEGASNLECNEHGGTRVTANLSFTQTESAVSGITWYMDDTVIGTDSMSINQLIPVGTHTIRAEVTLENGQTGTAVDIVTVNDTQRPDINVAFIDSRSGEAITSINSQAVSWVTASIVASDICDPSPTIYDNMGGFAVNNGDLLKVQGNNGTVQLTTDTLRLQAYAKDSANRTTVGYAELLVTP